MTSTRIRKGLFLATASLSVLALASCSGDDAPMQEPLVESAAPTEAPEEASEETPTADAEPKEGTRESPIAVDTLTQYDEDSIWKFAIGPTDTDAWNSTLKHVEYQLAEAPAEGTSYIMAPIHIEVVDDESGEAANPHASLDIQYVTAGGVTHRIDYGENCGTFDNAYSQIGDLYGGAQIDANICVALPTEGVPGGTWRVSYNGGGITPIFIEGAPE